MLRINGMLETGEVSALDIHRFRSRGNYAVVRSTRHASTAYVVFNETPKMQSTAQALFGRQQAPRAQSRTRGAVHSALSMQRTRRGQPLTTQTFFARLAEEWDRDHPASHPVDPAAAHSLVELLELRGDELHALLRRLDVLPDNVSHEVSLENLQLHLSRFAVVIAGGRAVHVCRPTEPGTALLCSCQRFGRRGTCPHTVFTETLTISGVRASTRDDLGRYLLQPHSVAAEQLAARAATVDRDHVSHSSLLGSWSDSKNSETPPPPPPPGFKLD